MGPHRGPRRAQAPSVGEVPSPGVRHRRGALAMARHHGHDVLGQGEQCDLGEHPRQMERPVRLEHGVQLVPSLQRLQRHPVLSRSGAIVGGGVRGRSCGHRGVAPACVGVRVVDTGPRLEHERDRVGPRPGIVEMIREAASPARQHLEMPHARPGRHEHPRPQDLGPPTQVEVLPHGEDVGVEASELGEEVEADEGAAAGGEKDVAHGVVLTVVDLARLHAVDDSATLVDRHADVQQPRRVVPTDQFRSHDAGVGPERLLHHDVHGVGVRGDVVVAEQQQRRAAHHREHFVGRGAEALVRRHHPHKRPRKHTCHARRGIHRARRVQDEDRQLRVVLRGEGPAASPRTTRPDRA